MKISQALAAEIKQDATKTKIEKGVNDMAKQIAKDALVNKVPLPAHVVTLLRWAYTAGLMDAREQTAKEQSIKKEQTPMNTKVTPEDMAKLYEYVDKLERKVYERKYNTVSIEKMDKSQLLETVLNYDRTQADRELAGDILLTKHCNGDATLFATLLKNAANIKRTGE